MSSLTRWQTWTSSTSMMVPWCSRRWRWGLPWAAASASWAATALANLRDSAVELLIFQALIGFGFDDETNLQKRHPEILDGLSLSLSFFVPYKSYICVYICTDTTRSFSIVCCQCFYWNYEFYGSQQSESRCVNNVQDVWHSHHQWYFALDGYSWI